MGHFVGLMQERRNSSALAMELHLFCTNPSIWIHVIKMRRSHNWLSDFNMKMLSYQHWYSHSTESQLWERLIFITWAHIDGLGQEKRNSIANALDLCLSCTNLSIYLYMYLKKILCIEIGPRLFTSTLKNVKTLWCHQIEKFSSHRWIPLTKASDGELWCFLWSAPEQTVEQTLETLVVWDAVVLIMMSM